MHQQEMFGALIPLKSLMIAQIISAEETELTSLQDIR